VTRDRLGPAAAALLLALLVLSQPLADLPRRVRSLAAFAPKELAVRRLGGSGAAFDRRYFSFLENARRRLPKSAAGIAIFGAPAGEAPLYLASYQFAPLPVLLSPPSIPAGWVTAVYGPERPPGARVLAELPEGVLLEPAP
jgi:hypothetical protein